MKRGRHVDEVLLRFRIVLLDSVIVQDRLRETSGSRKPKWIFLVPSVLEVWSDEPDLFLSLLEHVDIDSIATNWRTSLDWVTTKSSVEGRLNVKELPNFIFWKLNQNFFLALVNRKGTFVLFEILRRLFVVKSFLIALAALPSLLPPSYRRLARLGH